MLAVPLTFCEDDVEKAIDQLNTGKSTDEYGLLSQHFKAEKPEIVPVITTIFKDQMTKFKLFRCNCNILIELPMRIILPKTA